jgi:hypothetical protein
MLNPKTTVAADFGQPVGNRGLEAHRTDFMPDRAAA